MFDRNQMIQHITDRLEEATNAELEMVYWLIEMELA